MELDGELDAAEAALLRRHIARCAHCRAMDENFRVNRLLLHAMAPVRAPQDGLKRLQQKLGQTGPTRPAAPRRPSKVRPERAPAAGWQGRAVLQSAAVLVMVCTGTIFWLGYTDMEPPHVQPAHVSQPVAVQHPAALLRGYALVQASNPLADQSAWHYLASEAVGPVVAYSADGDPSGMDVRPVEPMPLLRDEDDPQ